MQEINSIFLLISKRFLPSSLCPGDTERESNCRDKKLLPERSLIAKAAPLWTWRPWNTFLIPPGLLYDPGHR